MTTYRVVFSRRAKQQLLDLQQYVTRAASRTTATRFTRAIVNYCEALRTFPQRGTLREDLGPGFRVTNFNSSTIIVFSVEPEQVSILGVFYGGQDYESLLEEPDE